MVSADFLIALLASLGSLFMASAILSEASALRRVAGVCSGFALVSASAAVTFYVLPTLPV